MTPPSINYIENIPMELLPLIAIHLSPTELQHLCQTSKKFNATICQNKNFLLAIIARDLTSNPQRLDNLRKKPVEELQELYQEAISSGDPRLIAKEGYDKYLKQLSLSPYILQYDFKQIIHGAIEGCHLDIINNYIDKINTGDYSRFDYILGDFFYDAGYYNCQPAIDWLLQNLYNNPKYKSYVGNISTYLERLMRGVIISSNNINSFNLIVEKFPHNTWDWDELVKHSIYYGQINMFYHIIDLFPRYNFDWADIREFALRNDEPNIVKWIDQHHPT